MRHPTRICLLDHEYYEFSSHKPFSRRLYELGEKYNINVDNRCEFNVPPWIKPKFNINLSIHKGPKAQSPIEILKQDSLQEIAKYNDSEHYYTDGSVNNNRTGIGIFNNHYSECIRLPNNTSIYTAESLALCMAMRQGLDMRKNFTVFTDSYSCLSAISNISDHPIITRIQNMLYHSSLTINLCWIPSHCNVFGNEHADRIAKRASNLNTVTNIRNTKNDMLSNVKRKLKIHWQQQYDTYHAYKIKDNIEIWESSYHENRLYEVTMARLRLNCVRGIHLIPHIENTYPLECDCGENRLSLNHIFFNCTNYTIQRLPIITILQKDNKDINLKNLLGDDNTYCKYIINFFRTIKFLEKI